ncbi:hypothetical protein D6D11_03752, partial [Aureobasidium pullulans]
MPLTNNDPTPSALRTPRRVHRKSRKGCANCKARKVKCDESKPQCRNCTTRDARCSFLPPTPCAASLHVSAAESLPSSQALPTASAIEVHTPNASLESGHSEAFSIPHGCQDTLSEDLSERLDISDFSLLHHYTISTAYTLAIVPGLQTFMRVSLPRLAFSNRFLLHGTLAIAALHLSRFKKDALEANFYTTKALYHYGIALQKATLLVKDVDTESGPALYLFSMLCFSFTLGVGPKRGDFLLFGKDGIADWFAQLRGMKSLLETRPEILHHGVYLAYQEIQ